MTHLSMISIIWRQTERFLHKRFGRDAEENGLLVRWPGNNYGRRLFFWTTCKSIGLQYPLSTVRNILCTLKQRNSGLKCGVMGMGGRCDERHWGGDAHHSLQLRSTKGRGSWWKIFSPDRNNSRKMHPMNGVIARNMIRLGQHVGWLLL